MEHYNLLTKLLPPNIALISTNDNYLSFSLCHKVSDLVTPLLVNTSSLLHRSNHLFFPIAKLIDIIKLLRATVLNLYLIFEVFFFSYFGQEKWLCFPKLVCSYLQPCSYKFSYKSYQRDWYWFEKKKKSLSKSWKPYYNSLYLNLHICLHNFTRIGSLHV